MELPSGYKHYDRKQYVARLNKAIYGLKQAMAVWFLTFSVAIQSFEYYPMKFNVIISFILIIDINESKLCKSKICILRLNCKSTKISPDYLKISKVNKSQIF